jgi:hypothetical protein
MTPPNVQRHLVCPSTSCGHPHWLIDIGASERCPACGVLGEPICACGCGTSLSDLRSDAVYRSEACSKRLQRAARPDKDPTRTIAEVRAEQEAAKTHWSMIVREGIIEVLKATGAYHADDLDHLGVPDKHRNIIGSQTAKLVNQKWMIEAGRRKSVIPSRNGAKSGIYQLTALGKQKLVGVSAGVPSPQGTEGASCPVSAGVDSGEKPTGSDNPEGIAGCESGPLDRPGGFNPTAPNGAGSSLAADSGKEESEVAGAHPSGSSPEPLSLLPEPERSAYERIQDAA